VQIRACGGERAPAVAGANKRENLFVALDGQSAEVLDVGAVCVRLTQPDVVRMAMVAVVVVVVVAAVVVVMAVVMAVVGAVVGAVAVQLRLGLLLALSITRVAVVVLVVGMMMVG
jgi:hypothetical protein